MTLEQIKTAVAATGLMARGAFHPATDDEVPQVQPGIATGTLVLIGSAGSSTWLAFNCGRRFESDPLDDWTRRNLEPIADAVGARLAYPGEKPLLPFLRWARRAEDVHSSPLGLLIHPEYGLWHAYRAALLVPARLEVPWRRDRPSPCRYCKTKPCLSACPVGSFQPQAFDTKSCLAYLSTHEGQTCRNYGCKARNACPIGREYRYPSEQIRFHMKAFADLPSN